MNFPEEIFDDALGRLPSEWLNGDRDALHSLLEKLMARRRRVPDLIEDCRRSSIRPFPNWT